MSNTYKIGPEKWSSCTGRYDTKDELLVGCKIHHFPCIKCGNLFSTNYSNGEDLRRKRMCFSCDFWDQYEKTQHLDTHAIIDGLHYVICSEDKGVFRGFGGRLFKILFNDGREVVTTNLWHQGTIPPHFRKRMPDNAKFM